MPPFRVSTFPLRSRNSIHWKWRCDLAERRIVERREARIPRRNLTSGLRYCIISVVIEIHRDNAVGKVRLEHARTEQILQRAEELVRSQRTSEQRLDSSTACWTRRNIRSASGRSRAARVLIGPQCLRTLRRPIAANSTANAGHSLDRR